MRERCSPATFQTEEARIARRQAQLDANAAARDAGDISDEENPGILALHGRKPVNPPVSTIPVRAASVESDVPPLIDAELPTIQAALDRADAVILVLDARDPQSFRSKYLEDLVLETQGKHKLLLVLNKADLIPRESATAWLTHLRAAVPEVMRGAVQVCLFKSSVAGSEGLEQGMLSKSVPWAGPVSLIFWRAGPPRPSPRARPRARMGLLRPSWVCLM